MADGNTPTYNLILPEIDGADGTWGISLNSNLGSLDSLLSGGTALSAITVSGTVTAGALAAGSLSSTSNLVLSANGGAAILGVNNVPNISVNAAGTQIAIATTSGGTGDGKILVDETSVTVYEDMDVRGTVTCDLVKLNPTGGADEGGQIEFQRAVDNQTAWYVDVYGSGTDTSLRFVDNDDTSNPVNRVLMTNTGIDVTGTVKGDSLTIDNGAGLTTAYINSATGASILTVKSTYEGGTEWQNVGVIEVGGHDKAYIDLKKPDTDDTDLRLLHDGDGSLTAYTGDLLLQTTTANSGGKVALVNGGNTRLETTSTGINVTGTVTADGLTLGAGEIATFNSGDVGSGNLQISGAATGSFSLIKQTGGGDLFIQGQNGHLRNDANESLVAWDGFKAELYWRGVSGAGAKLATTATGIDVTGKVECKDTVAITTTGSGTDPAPDLDFINLHSAAVDERLGQINYSGKNDGSTGTGDGQTKYAWTEVRTIDVTEDSEKAQHETWVKNGASYTRVLQVQPTGIDVVGTIECDTSLQITSSGTDVDAMPDFYMTNIETAAAAQNLGMIHFRGYNLATTPEITNYADVYAQQVVVTDGAEEGKLVFDVLGAGAKVEALAVTKDGIDVVGTVDLDNLTIATAQGTAGQVLKSTGSGIEWANDSGGSETLAQTLALGNATGGNDIVMGAADAIVGQQNNAVNIKNGVDGFIGLQTSDGYARVATTETDVKLYYGANSGTGSKKLETVDAGIDITGDLDVTGTITSNAFAYSKATVNNAADIAYTAFNSFAGKRIINTASATATTYGLPTPVAADIGKSWIICNPTDSEITIDHDASGTANYIWIMDGVTLSAAASSWTIKKGAVVEIVVAAAAAGSATAPNYLIFGAGLLEIV